MANRDKVLEKFSTKFKTRRNKDRRGGQGPTKIERQRQQGRERKMIELGLNEQAV